MNSFKIKVYKTVLKEVSEQYGGVEKFITRRTDDICSQEKLSAEQVICFVCFLVSFLEVK